MGCKEQTKRSVYQKRDDEITWKRKTNNNEGNLHKPLSNKGMSQLTLHFDHLALYCLLSVAINS